MFSIKKGKESNWLVLEYHLPQFGCITYKEGLLVLTEAKYPRFIKARWLVVTIHTSSSTLSACHCCHLPLRRNYQHANLNVKYYIICNTFTYLSNDLVGIIRDINITCLLININSIRMTELGTCRRTIFVSLQPCSSKRLNFSLIVVWHNTNQLIWKNDLLYLRLTLVLLNGSHLHKQRNNFHFYNGK